MQTPLGPTQSVLIRGLSLFQGLLRYVRYMLCSFRTAHSVSKWPYFGGVCKDGFHCILYSSFECFDVSLSYFPSRLVSPVATWGVAGNQKATLTDTSNPVDTLWPLKSTRNTSIGEHYMYSRYKVYCICAMPLKRRPGIHCIAHVR